ncbi:hypothetical protein BDF21DRAFT_410073 [Thamnidium elegans]|nr:hypothetical protein BDF21DRAFT_410073 [Thamnidium elegans]
MIFNKICSGIYVTKFTLAFNTLLHTLLPKRQHHFIPQVSYCLLWIRIVSNRII